MLNERSNKTNQELQRSRIHPKRVTQIRNVTKIVTIVVSISLALLILMFGIAAVLGGGFGVKQIGLLGELHSDTPLIMAHRGVRLEHPGNSSAAFIAAREQGFKAVEIDVKRSADGHFYLFHDRESMRLLGVDIDLSKQRLDELQRYRLYHHGQPTQQTILSLEAFVNEFSDDFIIYFDIKRHGQRNLQQLSSDIAAFIERHDLGQRAIVGGDFLFITWFEYRFPELFTSIGGPGDYRAKTYKWIPRRFRPDFMIVRASKVTPELIDWLNDSGLINRWIVYGVNVDNRQLVEQWGFSKLLID